MGSMNLTSSWIASAAAPGHVQIRANLQADYFRNCYTTALSTDAAGDEQEIGYIGLMSWK